MYKQFRNFYHSGHCKCPERRDAPSCSSSHSCTGGMDEEIPFSIAPSASNANTYATKQFQGKILQYIDGRDSIPLCSIETNYPRKRSSNG